LGLTLRTDGTTPVAAAEDKVRLVLAVLRGELTIAGRPPRRRVADVDRELA
jgi:hypothetical protein